MSTLKALSLLLFLSAVAASLHSAEINSMPEKNERGGDRGTDTKAVLKRVEELIDTRLLRLSTADQLRTHFHCVVRTAYTSADGRKHGSTCFLERDAGRVGVLLCSDEGLPFAYCTNDLLVGIDRANPRQLLYREKMNPVFVLAPGKKAARALCDLSFDSRVASPKLDIDLEDLLLEVVQTAKSGRTLNNGRTLRIDTQHGALVDVDLPGAEEKTNLTPVKSVFVSGAEGDSLAISSLDSGPLESLNLLGITRDSLRTLGVPVIDASPEDCSRVDISTREDFGQDVQERSTAKSLLTLFSRAPKSPRSGRLDTPAP